MPSADDVVKRLMEDLPDDVLDDNLARAASMEERGNYSYLIDTAVARSLIEGRREAIAEIGRLRAERDEARDSLSEEVRIVNRIWEMYGSPSYEELAGRSIYDLISEERQAAQLSIRELEEGLKPFARHAGGYALRDADADSIAGVVWLDKGERSKLTVADLRRARQLIERNSK